MVKKSKKKVKNSSVSSDCSKMSGNCGGCFYGLGFLGSAVYYIYTAATFWGGVVGVLKSLVWPAFLVFELLSFVGA